VESQSIKSSSIESLHSRWKLKEVISDNIDHNNADDDDVNNGGELEKWCEVQFDIEMSVSDPIMNVTLDQVWGDVARGQMNAFEKRCHEIPFQPGAEM